MAGARQERHRFELDGGTVALDFVNTVSGMRGSTNPRERLEGFADVVYWAEQVGLIDGREAARLYGRAEQDPARAAESHRQAIRRREALHDVVVAAVDAGPIPGAALETVNAWIADALAHRRFRTVAPGKFEASFEDDGDLLAFLRPVALDAAANLIRRRGGDVLERAEFARLFAAGEPQRGLAAFLNRRMRTDR